MTGLTRGDGTEGEKKEKEKEEKEEKKKKIVADGRAGGRRTSKALYRVLADLKGGIHFLLLKFNIADLFVSDNAMKVKKMIAMIGLKITYGR